MPRALSFCMNASLRASSKPVHLEANHPEGALGPILHPIEPDPVGRCDFGSVPIHDLRPAVEKFVDTLELRNAQRRLQIGDAVVEAPLLVKIPLLGAHRVIAQSFGALIKRMVVGGQHAAFAGRDDLVAVEAENAALPRPPTRRPLYSAPCASAASSMMARP